MELGDVGFYGGRKPENQEKNPWRRREPTMNSTHIWHLARIEPGQHWWEATVLITTPFLLP